MGCLVLEEVASDMLYFVDGLALQVPNQFLRLLKSTYTVSNLKGETQPRNIPHERFSVCDRCIKSAKQSFPMAHANY